MELYRWKHWIKSLETWLAGKLNRLYKWWIFQQSHVSWHRRSGLLCDVSHDPSKKAAASMTSQPGSAVMAPTDTSGSENHPKILKGLPYNFISFPRIKWPFEGIPRFQSQMARFRLFWLKSDSRTAHAATRRTTYQATRGLWGLPNLWTWCLRSY